MILVETGSVQNAPFFIDQGNIQSKALTNLKQNSLIQYFSKTIWKWAALAYFIIELLIQLNFYFKQYPDITFSHIGNSMLRLALFMALMCATWTWCYHISLLRKRYTVPLAFAGFFLYYFFTFLKNVYLLDYISSVDTTYSIYLQQISFWEFFIRDLAYSKDDILRYTILVAMFFGLDFFHKFRQAEEQRFALTLEKKQLEIDLMKWQLNPHFYFNTLHNLYGLASMKSDKTEECILKLSDIMQYIIYECKEPTVELKKELQFLRSYVEIEKLRYDEGTIIILEIEGDASNNKIIPLLLIQFIENGFKHGLKTKDNSCWLNITMSITGENLVLIMNNSLHKTKLSSGSNISMLTARNLLQSCYGQYEMTENYSDKDYSLYLNIDLDTYTK